MKHIKLRGIESLGLVGPDKTARQLRLMTPAEFTAWRDAGDAALQDWIAANAFTGTAGGALVRAKGLFGNTPDNRHACDAIGIIGDVPIWDAAAIARALPAGTWQLDLPKDDPAASLHLLLPLLQLCQPSLLLLLQLSPRQQWTPGQCRRQQWRQLWISQECQ